jgi:serpin B
MVNGPAVATRAINTFGLNLLADLGAHSKQENVFVSPLSLFSALAMTESGAAGSTRQAIRQALAVPADLNDEALQRSSLSLSQSLQSQKSVRLEIANAVWADAKLELTSAFVKRCQTFYQAHASSIDFSNPGAAGIINVWVKKKTQDKIPQIVAPADLVGVEVVVTNAVYFKGGWQYKFETASKEGGFHLAGALGADGTQKTVHFMHRDLIPAGYHADGGFEAAALPYESSNLALYAILPTPGKTPEQALAEAANRSLTSDGLDLDLTLPRFTLDFGAELNGPLGRMGMIPAFRPGADFKPMGSSKFYINKVLHKSHLEVDEEGTLAAAATAVEIALSAFPAVRPKKKILVFDRPFGLLLRDNGTGAILFAGVIYDPQ